MRKLTPAVAIFDLETTGLKADYAQIFCACIKEYGGVMRTIRCDDYPSFKRSPWDDRQLCLDIRDELERFDEISGWNNVFFDTALLNSRLLMHFERPMRQIKQRDLMLVAKKRLTIHNNRLDSVARAFGLEVEKTVLDPVNWMQAIRGANTPEGKESLDYIVDHCDKDVLITEQMWSILSPLVTKVF